MTNIFKKEALLTHVYSFVKTYVTVFIALFLYLVVDGKEEGTEIVLWNLPAIATASKWATISLLRNVYKMLTE